MIAHLWLATLLFVQAPAYPIAGTVVHSVTGVPLAGVRMSLTVSRSQKEVARTISADDGYFRFASVPAGKYSLVAEKAGFVTQPYGQRSLYARYSSAIVTAEGENTEGIVFRMIPSAAITGKVTDELNEPLPGLTIFACLRSGHGDDRRVHILHRATTNDLGEYRLHSLAKGAYFIAVTGRVWQSQDILDASGQRAGYAPAFHPGVSDFARAEVVTVEPGAQARADVRMSLAKTVTIQGRFAGAIPEGRAQAFLMAPMGKPSRLLVSELVNLSGPAFTIRDVPPGTYELTVAGGSQKVLARKTVTVESDPTEVTLGDAPMASVRAKVQLRGKPSGAGFLIGLLDEDSRFNPRRMLDESGSVDFGEVLPGRYTPVVYSGTVEAALLSITAGPGVVSGQSIVVPEAGQVDLRIVADADSFNVSGKVVHAGRPRPGVIVVLIPRSENATALTYRFDQTDSDGSFLWQAVPPGDYLAFAFEHGEAADYADEAVMNKLRAKGRPLSLKGGSNTEVRLELTAEEQ
ncbi:MAG: carboxypeptidase regulatory-like domain-containing protein [Candidatus Solibacter usitatus]|nr:carboxypeptidase regulatory-like domain-containing protein [Candidatus Solibacter usitatus]